MPNLNQYSFTALFKPFELATITDKIFQFNSDN